MRKNSSMSEKKAKTKRLTFQPVFRKTPPIFLMIGVCPATSPRGLACTLCSCAGCGSCFPIVTRGAGFVRKRVGKNTGVKNNCHVLTRKQVKEKSPTSCGVNINNVIRPSLLKVKKKKR